jgi:hypothetical protein
MDDARQQMEALKMCCYEVFEKSEAKPLYARSGDRRSFIRDLFLDLRYLSVLMITQIADLDHYFIRVCRADRCKASETFGDNTIVTAALYDFNNIFICGPCYQSTCARFLYFR